MTELVRAECVRCPWLLAETMVATILSIFGPSGVRALPLASGRNEGGHYFRYFLFLLLLFLLLGVPLFKTPEVDVGFQIFAWASY